MERVYDLGQDLALFRVHYTELREQDLNARTMPPEMFERLKANIAKEQRLESLPFGVVRGNRIEIISGHHRTRAAVGAGVETFFVIADIRDLDTDAVKSKQLSHNSIAGMDDPDMLRRIFDQIGSIDRQLEAFVSLEQRSGDAITNATRLLNEEIKLRWPVLTIAFLPTQMEQLQRVEILLAKQITKDSDEVWAVPEIIAERFHRAMEKVGRKFDLRTNGNILARMVAIVEESLQDDDPAVG